MAKLSAAQVYKAALDSGFSPTDAVIATQIAYAESKFDTNAIAHEPDGSTSYGLMQINSSHPDILRTGTWSDPVANMRMARSVKAQQTWLAWSTYKHGTYKELKVTGNPLFGGSAQFIEPDGKQTVITPAGPAVSTDPLGAVNGLIHAIMSPGLWTRIGIGWLGFVLVVLGILFLFWTAKDKVIGSSAAAVVKGVTK